MKIGKIVHLENVVSSKPVSNGIEYTDTSGARVFIPTEVILRLYEILKFDFERESTISWDEHSNEIMSS